MRLMRNLLPVVLLAACNGGRAESGKGADRAAFLHVVDPRLAQPGPAGAANRAALVAAMDRLRATPDRQSPPELFIITGDLTGVASTAPVAPPGTPLASSAGTNSVAADSPLADSASADSPRANPVSAVADSMTSDSAAAAPTVAGTPAPLPTGGTLPDASTRGTALDVVARMLLTTPAKSIYLAPSPSNVGLADSLRERIGSGVAVYDLTACYQAGNHAGCTADVPESAYRLVGFTPGSAGRPLTASVHRLDSLVNDAILQRKRVVIVASAVPASLTQPVAQGDTAANLWRSTLRRQQVVGLVTGGSPVLGERGEIKRVGALSPAGNVAPSRVVAEGRPTWFGLEYERLPYRVGFGTTEKAGGGLILPLIGGAVAWLWDLAPGAPNLPKFVIVAIAFLAASLTVAALWRLEGTAATPATAPAAPAPLVAPGAIAGSGAPAAAAGDTAAPPPALTYAFDNNYSRTILSGLGGLLVLSFLQISWQNLFTDANPFYVAWFIVLFMTSLWLYAFVRAVLEAIRSRIANPYVPPTFSPRAGGDGIAKDLAFVRYWIRRIARWVFSYRATVLVFADTALGVLLGRNQLRSAVWEQTIVDLHWSLSRVMEDVRKALSDALCEHLRIKAVNGGGPAPGGVRVSISLLSRDGRSVYYVLAGGGSLPMQFEVRSVAWLAITSGEARWWKGSYGKEVIVYNNTNGGLPGFPTTPLKMSEFYEVRSGADYKAFIVLPLPRGRVVAQEGRRRGAIHVSFDSADDFDRVWPKLDAAVQQSGVAGPGGTSPSEGEAPQEGQNSAAEGTSGTPPVAVAEGMLKPDYTRASEVYDLPEGPLGPMLRLAADVLGDAIERFDDDVFQTYIRPSRGR